MFNLIVAVISIALIAAMAAASIFYGGEAFSESTAQAQASTLVNNGQQISGAQQLYMIDNSGNRENVAADLVTANYLQALPTPPASVVDAGDDWGLNSDGKIAFIDLVDGNSGAVCENIVEQGGSTGTTDLVAGVAVTDLAGDSQFGCLSDGTDVVFAYKL